MEFDIPKSILYQPSYNENRLSELRDKDGPMSDVINSATILGLVMPLFPVLRIKGGLPLLSYKGDVQRAIQEYGGTPTVTPMR